MEARAAAAEAEAEALQAELMDLVQDHQEVVADHDSALATVRQLEDALQVAQAELLAATNHAGASTWVYEQAPGYASKHLDMRASTWIFKQASGYTSEHLRIRASTWVYKFQAIPSIIGRFQVV
jgi:hypothetical protein